MPLSIRPAMPDDAPAIAGIYAGHVLHGTATFELDPPDATEIARRLAAVTARGWPWLVAEEEGVVIGYAYLGFFRERPAYRFTCENSIYIHEGHAGRGAGRALMIRLIEEARRLGFRQMLAIIGDSGNAASIGLHAAMGFHRAGLMERVGYKFDRWLDVVTMQLALAD